MRRTYESPTIPRRAGCVDVFLRPSVLIVSSKVNLAQELEALGVDVIQTEGKFSLDPSK